MIFSYKKQQSERSRYLLSIHHAIYLIVCISLVAFGYNPVIGHADDSSIPAINVSKTADKSTAAPDDLVVYTITVNNPHNAQFELVHFQDQLPSTLVFDRFLSNPGTVDGTGLITWPYVFVQPSETVIYQYAVKIKDEVAGGTTVTNNASGRYCFDTHCYPFNISASVQVNTPTSPLNQPPTITLIGANPLNLFVGQSFTDPGATANDQEDGDITSRIVKTGTVNASVIGSYAITYTVTDSGGLSASTTRQVVINPVTPASTGTITFCLLLTDANDILATTSPVAFGLFSMNLGTTTNIFDSLIGTKNWTTATFSPNRRTILSVDNDSQCISFNDLPFGSYYYPQLSVTGDFWQPAKYNDQAVTAVNGLFDFYDYSPELFNATTTDDASRNLDSDGLIVLDSLKNNQTVYMLSKDNTPPASCIAPNITSSLSLGATVGTAFSYQFTATSTTPISISYSIGTSILPAGLTFSTTTGIISGTPTVSGTFQITLIATNGCGQTIQNATLTISDSGGGSSGGGGGGGDSGGSGGISGHRRDISGITSSGGQVWGTTSCLYLRDYLRKDWNNDPIEVLKVQSFLNVFEKENLSYTAVFDEATFQAVSRFQNKYFNDILAPWGHTAPTGFVYILTKKKINEIYCNATYPLTAEQQNEISAFKAYLQSVKDDKGQLPDVSGTVGLSGTDNPIILKTDRADKNATALESTSTDNGILSNNVLRSAAVSFFAMPGSLPKVVKGIVISLIILAFIYSLISFTSFTFSKNKSNNSLAVKASGTKSVSAPMTSYDKSLEDLAGDIVDKEEAKEAEAEEQNSKRGFKGILDR